MPIQENETVKQSNEDRLKDITDSIEKGIKELFESDKYKQYLTTMSQFHRYSVNNQMLIYMQKPNATHVVGFNKWRDQFERNVLKGQRGITHSAEQIENEPTLSQEHLYSAFVNCVRFLHIFLRQIPTILPILCQAPDFVA